LGCGLNIAGTRTPVAAVGRGNETATIERHPMDVALIA
jgi:hypothetical protein